MVIEQTKLQCLGREENIGGTILFIGCVSKSMKVPDVAQNSLEDKNSILRIGSLCKNCVGKHQTESVVGRSARPDLQ